MYTIYVLKNRTGKIYIGQSSNLNRRIIEHNITGTGYTSKHRPWEIVYTEDFETRKDAMAREKYFKTGKGREELEIKLTGT